MAKMLERGESILPASGEPDAAAPLKPTVVDQEAGFTAPSAEGCLKRWGKHLGRAGPLAAVMIVLPVVGGGLLLGFIRQLAPWLKHHASAGTLLLATLCIAGLA